MKRPLPLFSLFSLVLLLAGAAGCASSRPTESRLSASGFKVIPATTPQQLQQLATLPAGRVTPVQRQGKVYFVYPDSSQKLLFVGGQKQYQSYQQLLLDEQATAAANQATEAEANAATYNAAANIITSEPWGVGVYDGPWGVFGPWPVWP